MTLQSEVLFNNAQLSLAAYADGLESGGLQSQVGALQEAGMSQIQAQEFASKYSVVTQIGDTLTGFSATIFKDSNNQLTVAFRGTNDPIDLLHADFAQIVAAGAARTQIIEMYNWWQKVSHQNGAEVDN